jgi:hypothetical protein
MTAAVLYNQRTLPCQARLKMSAKKDYTIAEVVVVQRILTELQN